MVEGKLGRKKEEGNDNVDVLWVQTKDMKNQLLQTNPLVFECDTTFGTLAEGYKLYLPAFHSKFTNKWEIGGLLFLSTREQGEGWGGIEILQGESPLPSSWWCHQVHFLHG